MSQSSDQAPILHHPTREAAVFLPDNLLDRAATMLGKERGGIPPCCVLDADAELIPIAMKRFSAEACAEWTCFHTTLVRLEQDGFAMGLIGGTVGAPFAVLVAEQLIACGCRCINERIIQCCFDAFAEVLGATQRRGEGR